MTLCNEDKSSKHTKDIDSNKRAIAQYLPVNGLQWLIHHESKKLYINTEGCILEMILIIQKSCSVYIIITRFCLKRLRLKKIRKWTWNFNQQSNHTVKRNMFHLSHQNLQLHLQLGMKFLTKFHRVTKLKQSRTGI